MLSRNRSRRNENSTERGEKRKRKRKRKRKQIKKKKENFRICRTVGGLHQMCVRTKLDEVRPPSDLLVH